MAKVIMHIDLNAFFATAEKLRDPTLIGKPLIIGGKGRAGIVSTCSYEARQYGCSSGMPTYKAIKLCPHAIVLGVDFKYYSSLSKQFFKYLREVCPIIEPASIDEAFVDVTDVIKGKNAKEFFLNLQKGLYKKTGLQCSIGIAPTKFLAKMGSDMQKPMGLTILRRRDFREKLYPLPIKDMFGIGKKTYPRLEAKGVKTIGDLAYRINSDDPEIINMMGKFVPVLKDWLNGYGDDTVVTEQADPKSIGTSTTLPMDTTSLDDVSETLKELAKDVSKRAIKENKKGRTIQIVIKDNHFKLHNKSVSFDVPINDYYSIYNKAISLYEKHFDGSGIEIRLVGVTLQNLVAPEDEIIQMTLFDYEKYEEKSRTKLLINELNRKAGKDLFIRASEAKKK